TASGVAGAETSQTVATTSIFAGEVVTLSEIVTAAGGARYAPSLTCSDPTGLTYTPLSSTGTYTVPASPTPVTCTFTNVKEPPLVIVKAVVGTPSRNPDGTYA